jgi:hypothetical protein
MTYLNYAIVLLWFCCCFAEKNQHSEMDRWERKKKKNGGKKNVYIPGVAGTVVHHNPNNNTVHLLIVYSPDYLSMRLKRSLLRYTIKVQSGRCSLYCFFAALALEACWDRP